MTVLQVLTPFLVGFCGTALFSWVQGKREIAREAQEERMRKILQAIVQSERDMRMRELARRYRMPK